MSKRTLSQIMVEDPPFDLAHFRMWEFSIIDDNTIRHRSDTQARLLYSRMRQTLDIEEKQLFPRTNRATKYSIINLAQYLGRLDDLRPFVQYAGMSYVIRNKKIKM